MIEINKGYDPIGFKGLVKFHDYQIPPILLGETLNLVLNSSLKNYLHIKWKLD